MKIKGKWIPWHAKKYDVLPMVEVDVDLLDVSWVGPLTIFPSVPLTVVILRSRQGKEFLVVSGRREEVNELLRSDHDSDS